MAHNNLSGHLDSDIQSDEDAEKLAQAAFDHAIKACFGRLRN